MKLGAERDTALEAIELAAILDTMADGVFVIGNDHVIRRWNRAMEHLTGYRAGEAVGEDCGLLESGPGAGPGDGTRVLECDLFAAGAVDGVERVIRRADGAELPVIMSGRVMKDAAGEAMGAVVTMTDVSSVRRLEREVTELRQAVEERFEFHNIVGRSAQMREVFGLIEMAAASQVTVLLTGETGTGKELVAKAIHYHSERHAGPLVSVNCSALSESLLESELFGHVHGAFTGAVKDSVGRFERAHGGTIFLDEIGDLPPVVQVKLLRVLQEREVERVGDSTPRPVDVRVIAATHRDLRDLVRQGRFREDLFYRLKVFPIALPPLRSRKEDIEPLMRRFIARFNEETGKRLTGLTPDAMRIVMDYCWPGNVRELENAVEHAFVTCPGPEIGPFDLPIEIRRVELRTQLCDQGPMSASAGADEQAPRPPRRRRPATAEELLRLLAECDWNKAEVARRLGITRTSVWRRMKALGLPLEPPEP
ncbi:MAG: sigma 54-interacting transcriptional regulator [Candidatus Hydrogenedentes bacterium]|nr:sigma 54-interacting transcriptional regulator [Candidatus Hydrogenedentota bacterium]